MLIPTKNTTYVRTKDNRNENVVLEDIPLYIDKENENMVINLADVVKANQKRIAKKFGISVYNIFELALLYADVKQRSKVIKQKYRFNKMLFYIWKELEKIYGENSIIFDEMWVAPEGPIPANLMNDLIQFQTNDVVEVFLIEEGKKIAESKKKREEIKKSKKDEGIRVSIACGLTNKGEELSKAIWSELDSEMREIILKMKERFYFMKTGKIKKTVHKEYPEYRKFYTKEDKETFKLLLKKQNELSEIKELNNRDLPMKIPNDIIIQKLFAGMYIVIYKGEIIAADSSLKDLQEKCDRLIPEGNGYLIDYIEEGAGIYGLKV